MILKFKQIKNTLGKVFLNRLTIYLPKGSLKLHIITGDDSPEYHNHPWDFTSFVLFGGYKEYIYIPNRELSVDLIKWHYLHTRNNMITLLYKRRMFSINKKHHNQQHRVELFKLFGFKIPAITIGYYSDKLQLCSFCKEAGRCLQNKH